MGKPNIKKDSATVKELNSQLQIIEGKVIGKKSEIANHQKELDLLFKQQTDIKKKIESLSNVKKPVVSEHAILRYLERVENLDVERVRAEILNESVMKFVNQFGGNGTFPHEKGFQIVMKNNMVVTIKI